MKRDYSTYTLYDSPYEENYEDAFTKRRKLPSKGMMPYYNMVTTTIQMVPVQQYDSTPYKYEIVLVTQNELWNDYEFYLSTGRFEDAENLKPWLRVLD